MREIEYCIFNFDKNFHGLKEEKIAVYGTGAYAKRILEEYPEYPIDCLVDDSKAGRYIEGHYVITLLQMLELDIKTVIIAAQISSAEIVYKRIAPFCKAGQITIYNMYGVNMYKVHADLTRKEILYPRLEGNAIKKAIDRNEVISFDVSDTLFIVKETLIPRKAVIEALQYAISREKQICLIYETGNEGRSGQIHEKLLNEYGINTHNFLYLIADGNRDKYTGLFRELKAHYGEISFLHIGDEEESDILVPQFYGIETFLVKAPFELFHSVASVSDKLLNIEGIRILYEKYVIATCSDDYLMKKIEAKRVKEKELVFQQLVMREGYLEKGNDYCPADNGDKDQKQKQILVFDSRVPQFDQDAGERCTLMYLKLFIQLGLKVTFIGNNFQNPEPYAAILKESGINVIYGKEFAEHWQEWLITNLKQYDYIYLQRPNVSIKYIDMIKMYGTGKIFYFAHDLHHVRLYRMYQISGDEELREESFKIKKLEMELFSKADVCHVVGSYEQKVVQDNFPDKKVRNIPLYIYEQLPGKVEKDFTKREDIIFVGGFNHKPNVDAVLWFASGIFPKVLQKHPQLKWHIVGSNVPEEVLKLSCDNIIIDGYLSDVELAELYGKCRLAVVPLRYGAGVKGKVVEAAYYQIPLVTTSIGGEGLDQSTRAFMIADNEKDMADLIGSLYTEYEKLKMMSDAGLAFIKQYFTMEVAKMALLEDLDL